MPVLLALLALAAGLSAGEVDFDGRSARENSLLRRLSGAMDFLTEPPPAVRGAPVAGPAVILSRAGDKLGEAQLWSRLDGSDIVYVGEQHESEAHHALQLRALSELRRRRPGLAVGLEMIDVEHQAGLDAWVAGRMTEAELEKFWAAQWGWFELYKPILLYARTNAIPLKALNAPRRVIRQISKGGVASLSPADRALLPDRLFPIAEPRYLEFVKRTAREHRPNMTPEEEQRMVDAQAAWNCRMAASALETVAEGRPLLVVAGMGHMLYRAGIMESVSRRAGASQTLLLPFPIDGGDRPQEELERELRDPASGSAELADYLGLLPAAGPAASR